MNSRPTWGREQKARFGSPMRAFFMGEDRQAAVTHVALRNEINSSVT